MADDACELAVRKFLRLGLRIAYGRPMKYPALGRDERWPVIPHMNGQTAERWYPIEIVTRGFDGEQRKLLRDTLRFSGAEGSPGVLDQRTWVVPANPVYFGSEMVCYVEERSFRFVQQRLRDDGYELVDGHPEPDDQDAATESA